jgi:hypothetical protein
VVREMASFGGCIMTIGDLLKAVDTLTTEELQMLRERLDQLQHDVRNPEPESLASALEKFREGLTDEQLDQIEWAMNVEVIKPPDKSAWQE